MNSKKLDKMFAKNNEAINVLTAYAKMTDPKSEVDKLCNWIANTDENSYGFFLDSGWASATCSVQGMYSLFSNIQHALEDDGELSFIIVNGSPKIVFAWADEVEQINAQVKQSIKQGHCYGPVKLTLDAFKTVDEFIQGIADARVRDVKKWFLFDAMKRREYAIKYYSTEYPDIYDPEWEKEVKDWTFND